MCTFFHFHYSVAFELSVGLHRAIAASAKKNAQKRTNYEEKRENFLKDRRKTNREKNEWKNKKKTK